MPDERFMQHHYGPSGYVPPIKACPFCGRMARLIDAPEAGNEGAVVVECHSCHASGPVVFGVKDDPKPHAIYCWNQRSDEALADQIKRKRTEQAENTAFRELLQGVNATFKSALAVLDRPGIPMSEYYKIEPANVAQFRAAVEKIEEAIHGNQREK